MSFLQSFQEQLQQTTQQLTTSLNSLKLQDTAAQLSSTVQKEVNNLKPIFARTTRSLQERFGSIDDISELPKEYKDLERRVDNIRQFFVQVLEITRQYELEAYDNPSNLKESLTDYTSLINEKITELSQASTTQDAEKVLLSGRKDKTPRTFAHQFSKTLKTSRDNIIANKPVSALPINIISNNDQAESSVNAADQSTNGASDEAETETPLTTALLKISESEYKIGNERLEQDKLIIIEFNTKVKNLLSQDFVKCSQLRSQVENARLGFDTVRAEIKSVQNGNPEVEVPENLSKKLETCEDELVNATEVAVEAMKELIKPLESINLLKLLFKIQLNYHKNVVAELTSLVGELDAIPLDDEE
ncbi:hypothetical protein PICMEDRAFT_72164 [Pichia membranifaciens NRRL Y-2026]|uniref:BAR domain-containing protein n=1 Tax=Pichia membranifaciens NRRL Y-2026 TaxID=763406 RepID=A0A1E3NQ08_9ASCO|nr:hypothetical protein PICMEDRAFT_72164 [Pichia membranifaciens NRRL Y-2026]ODQ48187.1 hypothetical protein PICMEDRAFT_72164 [Pichia membranifaciens NRRL Y-2026]